jgi:pimeloyl-ACP methyl ester carboxylesterase
MLFSSRQEFNQEPIADRPPRSGTLRLPGLVSVLIVSLVASGCTDLRRVFGFKEQANQARAISRISGDITTEGETVGHLVVILGRVVHESGKVVGVDSYVRVNSGTYAFAVAPGRFQLGAYEDRNRNGLLDPNERAIRVTDSEILSVGAGEEARLNLRLAKDDRLTELVEPLDVLAIVERTPAEQREFSLWAFSAQGEICGDLSDKKFGPASGPRGLWEPMNFLNDGLAGIYFLESYDPDRIPVLFVHGIAGFPQEFSTMIESLDRKRFQPWFYFYPSGFGLDGIANHLSGLLKRLQVRHDFDRIAIVAHSMGGLVSRGAILKYKEDTERDDTRLLMTISTPWGGDISAAAAQDARIELPASFADMSPSSDYLGWIFYQDESRKIVRRLPALVDFHMVMGFRMNRIGRVANDGSVPMASQARVEAQEEALSIRTWDYDHWEILKSPEAIERLSRLLESRF